MVGYTDGSVLAQMGAPDMRTAIGYALAVRSRAACRRRAAGFRHLARLDFEAPDEQRFPALRLARVSRSNAAARRARAQRRKEAALDAFIEDQIGFLDMAEIVEEVMGAMCHLDEAGSMEAVFSADAEARRLAEGVITRKRKAA